MLKYHTRALVDPRRGRLFPGIEILEEKKIEKPAIEFWKFFRLPPPNTERPGPYLLAIVNSGDRLSLLLLSFFPWHFFSFLII